MAIFISHASDDKGFVTELRWRLEAHRLSVWVDARNLRGGDKLNPAIEEAIRRADHCLVVLSPRTVNSAWVRREIRLAKAVAMERDDFRVIPLLLDGIKASALELWFEEEPLGVQVTLETSGLDGAFPQILAALGVELPADFQPFEQPAERPLADLMLKLGGPSLSLEQGKQRLRATATLVYEPPDYPKAPRVEGRPFVLTAPLGTIEAEDLHWYLERYHIWPVGLFLERAQGIEERLPQWGSELFNSALAGEVARAPLEAWKQAKGKARRFSVEVDHVLPEGREPKEQKNALEAATALMSLPWELLHDGHSYLFQGAEPVAVRRRLPNRQDLGAVQAELPIRILLISPRPEDDAAGYIDHRISAQALVQAVVDLGDLVELTVLDEPTFPALRDALKQARARGRPFDVVHFNGHGVFDAEHGLGALCFEDPKDKDKLQERATALVHADDMAALIRDYRIPLFFLEACQSAQSEKEPNASVAAKLLELGCSAVVAMGYSVLVETARRFTGAFYGGLARGDRLGEAFLAGQCALHDDSYRLEVMGAGRLDLQDWFVPVLYQEAQDPVLFTELPAEMHKLLQDKRRTLSLGAVPEPPPQTFIGRSRELLALERLLYLAPYAVIRGTGGAGKTTLAAELARWLVATNRFARAAFVSLEEYSDPRSILDSLGEQLVPDWKGVAEYGDLDKAGQHVDRALRDYASILIIDNFESILPPAGADQEPPFEKEGLGGLLDLFTHLRTADCRTRLLFTTRERLPTPFDHPRRTLILGPLSERDAIDLVAHVLKYEGLEPETTDPGRTPEEIAELVEAVGLHARALVLLAREVARRGVRATTEALREIMFDLERRHPGDRERSLHASLELSLERLPTKIREQVRVLAPFNGGAYLGAVVYLLDGDRDAAQELADSLIDAGLAQDLGYGHLGLDPALPSYLAPEVGDPDELEARWAETMDYLLGDLVEQIGKNSQLAYDLTRLELANLLRFLELAEAQAEPKQVVNWSRMVEALVAHLGLPSALSHARRIRERAAERLVGDGQSEGEGYQEGKWEDEGEVDRVDWSRAVYLHRSAAIDRLLEQGDMETALIQARDLLGQCQDAGEEAYPEATIDTAMATFKLGRALRCSYQFESALQPISVALLRFQALGQVGERMVSVCLGELGICQTELDLLDEAAATFQEGVEHAERSQDHRQIAICKLELGTVRLHQRRYEEALDAYDEVRPTFEALGEPDTLLTIWQQTGKACRGAADYDKAEHAFRQALRLTVIYHNRFKEAHALVDLGDVYDAVDRLKDAASCYRQAAEIAAEIEDRYFEGLACDALASNLVKQKLFEEASTERRRAVTAQLAYRREGGEPQQTSGHICDQLAADIATGATDRAAEGLAQVASDPDRFETVELHTYYCDTLLPKLRSILQGARDTNLADDPALAYTDVAELTLLLERLDTVEK